MSDAIWSFALSAGFLVIYSLPSSNTSFVKVVDILCLIFAGLYLGLGVAACLQ